MSPHLLARVIFRLQCRRTSKTQPDTVRIGPRPLLWTPIRRVSGRMPTTLSLMKIGPVRGFARRHVRFNGFQRALGSHSRESHRQGLFRADQTEISVRPSDCCWRCVFARSRGLAIIGGEPIVARLRMLEGIKPEVLDPSMRFQGAASGPSDY